MNMIIIFGKGENIYIYMACMMIMACMHEQDYICCEGGNIYIWHVSWTWLIFGEGGMYI